MNGDDFIPLLGRTSDDADVKSLLAAFEIQKQPKLEKGDLTAVVKNEKRGIEITFRDERFLDVKSRSYEEGALVLSNVCMYAEGFNNFHGFEGALPHGITFSTSKAQAEKLLGKPSQESKYSPIVRWDLKGYCVFVRFTESLDRVLEASVQVPVK
jgi:hypothetical protein